MGQQIKVSLTEQTWLHDMSVTSENPCQRSHADVILLSLQKQTTAVQNGVATEADNPASALQRGATVLHLLC